MVLLLPETLLAGPTFSAASPGLGGPGAGDGALVLEPAALEAATLGDEEKMLLPRSAGSDWLVCVVRTWSLVPPTLLVVVVPDDVALATLAAFVPPAVGVCWLVVVLAVDDWLPVTPLVPVLVLPPLVLLVVLVLVLPAVVVERMGVRMAWM